MDLRPPPRSTDVGQPRARVALLVGLQVVTLAAIASLGGVLWSRRGEPRAKEAGLNRDLASKLKAAGALDEAASLYETYLTDATDSPDTRAKVAYSLGNVYLESGQYEKALRWFYAAEMLGAKDLSQEIGERVVVCLERLGRVQAAKSALAARTDIAATDKVQRPADDLVLAKIGEHEIRNSDLQKALDDLPPELAQRFADPSKREDFLKKIIADELILQKAQKLGYDKDPVVRRRYEALFKQLVVSAFVEREVVDKIQVGETDLKAYFEANKERFAKKDPKSGKTPSFNDVKQPVEREYRMAKVQEAYQTLIQQELAGARITLFPENLKKTP
jgi:tetratricopeptide (TPR) repeat protein